jgi:hypothetical protein
MGAHCRVKNLSRKINGKPLRGTGFMRIISSIGFRFIPTEKIPIPPRDAKKAPLMVYVPSIVLRR